MRTHTKFGIKILEIDLINVMLLIFDLLTPLQVTGPKKCAVACPFYVTHTPNMVEFRPMIKEEIA